MTDETTETVGDVQEAPEEAPKKRGRPKKVVEDPPRQLAEHRARLEEADKVRGW